MARTRLTVLDGEVLEMFSSNNSFLGTFSLDSSGNIIIKNGTFPNSAERMRIAPGGKIRLSTTSASRVITTDSNNDINSQTVLSASLGGLGNSNTFVTGDILRYSGGSFDNLADVATGNALISGGIGVVPSWGKINLSTHVSGILPILNGGTNNSSFASGGVIYFDGTKLTNGNLSWNNTDSYLTVGENMRIYSSKITDTSGNSLVDWSSNLTISKVSTGSISFFDSAADANALELKNDGTSKIGFFTTTPFARPSAYTQTYSTASRTMENTTAATVSTTAATQSSPWIYTTQAQAHDIITQINNLRSDLDDAKKVANQICDHLQSYGLLQ